ncbi:MAG: hypothetical protein A2741_03005 [Candidatus Zambryskibacteria bacterium RIFCSPHIGHO2_01_FULL_43_27]|uniref:Uncharacterized protein n=1 Tax=Candidatus Zambryskibacteria bacterium RIFCSPLOWO2_01_FULL_43_17 TaxID=1802760 RepID=A0A1G2U5R7_9BACT|nr:MAG: hypothetical protein A2741_03005 [Candidatus Zambryskibacteria bacterium RIFCSPHIGHO2_01_FULL_43_27]OHA99412.1 MAG: hypothetical protein A3E93_00080 [Candidatus Zambryskibacteria bacterium RIFCSPHIGHO2_12_FULL_43_12b]OHB04836.1 MAG: hypothetical protein A2920_00590 [Candidatus Zambryskibacteria bacterium RIFCSPLOWO2_01_FULL_43_17]
MDKRQLKKIIEANADLAVDILLETPFWPKSLNDRTLYRRRSDDTDGADDAISVTFSSDGDGWIEVESSYDPESTNISLSQRFRMPLWGGGRSPHVRNALLILAVAISLDNKELPDPVKKPPE